MGIVCLLLGVFCCVPGGPRTGSFLDNGSPLSRTRVLIVGRRSRITTTRRGVVEFVLYHSSQRLAHGCRNVEAYGLGWRSLGGRYRHATVRNTTINCRADIIVQHAVQICRIVSGVPRNSIIQSAYHGYQQSHEVDPA